VCFLESQIVTYVNPRPRVHQTTSLIGQYLDRACTGEYGIERPTPTKEGLPTFVWLRTAV
jgi:hypothetical protein